MSDGSLSQDEIDALLQGGGGFDLGGSGSSSSAGLSDTQLNAFAGIIKGNIAAQAANLGGIIGRTAEIGDPRVELISREDFLSSAPDEVVEIRIDLTEAVNGEHSYIFPAPLATSIAGLMMGQEQIELDDASLSALSEAGNTLAGALATALGEKAGGTVMTAPGETQKALKAAVRLDDNEFVRVSYPLTLEGEDTVEYYEIFSMPIVNNLVAQEATPSARQTANVGMGGGGFQQQAPGGMSGAGMPGSGMQGGIGVQQVQFPNLYQQPHMGEQGNIGLLMDVYMELTVELGRTKRPIREILGFGEGTIIELDKLAGESVDILVNHKLIAKGEVVVIDENFGVRVTDIVNPMEQMMD